MLTVFRKIRQNLLTKSKTIKPPFAAGRYLKYALGEIVLVVIGILLALQINNWNEARKAAIEEQNALVNIHRDFLDNKVTLLALIKKSKIVIKSGLQILQSTGKKPKPKTEEAFNKLLNETFNTSNYFPRNGFLDDLINSGKLSVFKNPKLRNVLSSWKPKIEKVQGKFEECQVYENDLNRYVIKSGSWLNADAVAVIPRKFQFPASGFDVDNRAMLLQIEFENLIENLVINLDNYILVQEEALELLENILELLAKEIKKHHD